MDGVKVALGNRGMTVGLRERVESPGTYVTDEFHSAILAWHCVLSNRPPSLWWLSPGEGWDAVR